MTEFMNLLIGRILLYGWFSGAFSSSYTIVTILVSTFGLDKLCGRKRCEATPLWDKSFARCLGAFCRLLGLTDRAART
jgi:hypothetical protein